MQQKGIGGVEVISLKRPVKRMLGQWLLLIEIESVKREISENYG
jgi:hypothetical protein